MFREPERGEGGNHNRPIPFQQESPIEDFGRIWKLEKPRSITINVIQTALE
jgi:hypothetical protein